MASYRSNSARSFQFFCGAEVAGACHYAIMFTAGTHNMPIKEMLIRILDRWNITARLPKPSFLSRHPTTISINRRLSLACKRFVTSRGRWRVFPGPTVQLVLVYAENHHERGRSIALRNPFEGQFHTVFHLPFHRRFHFHPNVPCVPFLT